MKNPKAPNSKLTKAQLLVENGRLHREIEHRVRNTLQVVASLIDVTARSAGDRSALSVLEALRARVTAMIMVYQTLDDTPHRAAIDMDEALRGLALEVIDAGVLPGPRRIIDVHSQGVNLALDDAIPLTLMVVEVLLATASDVDIEGDASPVSIVLSRDVNEGSLRIELDAKQPGPGRVAWPQATQLMMAALARQLGGPLQIDVLQDVTQAVEIRFPVRTLALDSVSYC